MFIYKFCLCAARAATGVKCSDVNETFSFETETRPRPRPRRFSRCRKRYSLLSFWLQTATSYALRQSWK